MFFIIGKKVILRDWKLKDLPIFKKWNQGYNRWMDFDGPYYPKLTENKLQNIIDKLRIKILNNSFESQRKRLIICKKGEDELIGYVNCYWKSKETNWLACGITIYDENNWGKGLGFEALGLWNQYLFENFKEIIRLDIETWSGNIAIQKLAEKLGYKKEAIYRKARIVNGKYYDSVGYGILKEEWYDVFQNKFQ